MSAGEEREEGRTPAHRISAGPGQCTHDGARQQDRCRDHPDVAGGQEHPAEESWTHPRPSADRSACGGRDLSGEILGYLLRFDTHSADLDLVMTRRFEHNARR